MDREIRKLRIQKSKKGLGKGSSIDEVDIDYYSDDSDEFDESLKESLVPKRMKRNFEFTDSYAVIRIIKMILYIEIIAIFSEHTSIRLPMLFTIFCRGILFYSVRFYSRPFLDLVYVVQLFFGKLSTLISYLNINLPPLSEIHITGFRRLSNSNYAPVPAKKANFGATINFLDPFIWHSAQYFSHYFLGIMFFVMAIFFILKFWSISDYTNREEVQKWLENYIADGWIYRGGFALMISILRGCLAVTILGAMLFIVAREFTVNSLPEPRIVGSFVIVIVSVSVVIWFLGYELMKATERAFTRYVSQNVSYTSSIILKRVLKSKIELGIAFLILLYLPFLSNLVHALTVITDWNSTLAMSHRRNVNRYVPCYFLAFPPYSITNISPDQCPVSWANSPDLPITSRSSGYYYDNSLVACDSYLGIAFFTLSTVIVVFTILGFGWIFYRFISVGLQEFWSSRWINTLTALQAIRADEERTYSETFVWVERWLLDLELEYKTQVRQVVDAINWILNALLEVAVGLLRNLILSPLKLLISPFLFLWHRFMIVACNDCTLEGRRRKALERLRQEQMNNTVTEESSVEPSIQDNDIESQKIQQFIDIAQQLDKKVLDQSSSQERMFQVGFSGNVKSPVEQEHEVNWDEQSLDRVKMDHHQEKYDSQSNLNTHTTSESLLGTRNPNQGLLVVDKKATRDQKRRDLKEKKIQQMIQYDEQALMMDARIASIPEVILSSIQNFVMSLPCVYLPIRWSQRRFREIYTSIKRSNTIAYMKLIWSQWKGSLLEKLSGKPMGMNLGLLGGDHAIWRASQSLFAKCRSIRNLNRRIADELRRARLEFIMDHQLTITIFDQVIDTSGLMILFVSYRPERSYWSMMLWIELTLIAIGSAAMDYYNTWQEKIEFVMAVVFLFGVATYLAKPFTEDADRWLDFLGRLLILICGGSILYCSTLITSSSYYGDLQGISIFRPWESARAVKAAMSHQFLSTFVLDAVSVLYFFLYIYFTLKSTGLFRYLQRKIDSWKFAFHDNVLNMLVEKMDEETVGFENIHTSYLLIQQWDDIIFSQRRYALLTWPDVRPARLLSCSEKMLHVQWASMFNLTLKNLRSSLGLSVLHTTMCDANAEISRWLISHYSELLVAEDSQRDTPILIALKECAYNLIQYGKQNQGYLDDGTSYCDDSFYEYYPEIETLRDEVISDGEFLEAWTQNYFLDSRELHCLQRDGYFIETALLEAEKRQEASFKKKKVRKKTLKDIASGEDPNRQFKEEEAVQKAKDAKAEAKLRRKQARKEAEAAYKEKISLFQKRFPEDAFIDDFESGVMNSWKLVGLQVPGSNIFLDVDIIPHGTKEDIDLDGQDAAENGGNEMMNPKDTDNANVTSEAPQSEIKVGEQAMEDEENQLLSPKNRMVAAPKSSSSKASKKNASKELLRPTFKRNLVNFKNANAFDDDFYDRYDSKLHHFIVNTVTNHNNQFDDLEFIIDSGKDIIDVGKNGLPPDNEALAHIGDWDNVRSGKKSSKSILGLLQDSKSIVGEIPGQSFSYVEDGGCSPADREIRYRLCRFAEIFMSSEVASNCVEMKWDVAAFKELNKMANIDQGRLAQHLALVLNLNPPEGFSRLSEWTMGIPAVDFDDAEEASIPWIIRGALKIVEAGEVAANFGSMIASNMAPKSNSRRSRFRALPKPMEVVTNANEGASHSGSSSASLGQGSAFCDRIITFLAESMVASRRRLELSDLELGIYGRTAWRALVRALRRKFSSFVIPSLFTPAKIICLECLILTRNELDDGDCVLISEIVLYQQTLRNLDLSFNRIGSRGFHRLAQVLKSHESILTVRMDSNRLGPGCGKSIGIMLKMNKTIKVLTMSSNHLGKVIRYPTSIQRQLIPSAARDMFTGLRSNLSLQQLDISYNHMGSDLCDLVPWAVNKHPTLTSLNISGNDLGNERGPAMIFSLAGQHGGQKLVQLREDYYRQIKMSSIDRLKGDPDSIDLESDFVAKNDISDDDDDNGNMVVLGAEKKNNKHKNGNDSAVESTPSTPKRSSRPQSVAKSIDSLQMGKSTASTLGSQSTINTKGLRCCRLADLGIADNQLGYMTGHALSALLKSSRYLTSLDVSGNSLGPSGGEAMMDGLEYCFGMFPKDNQKAIIAAMEEKRLERSQAQQEDGEASTIQEGNENALKQGGKVMTRKLKYTNLLYLNIARNGLGPTALAVLMNCLSSTDSTLLEVDISDNPLGGAVHKFGSPETAAIETRIGMAANQTLLRLNLGHTSFLPMQLVPIFGGLGMNRILTHLSFRDTPFDEPACLQCAHAIHMCQALFSIDLFNCNMGPKGGILVVNRIQSELKRLRSVNIGGNQFGPLAASVLGDTIADPYCQIRTLCVSSNEFLPSGGALFLRSLQKNISLTDLDVSSNQFDEYCGELLGLVTRGLYIHGRKVSDCNLSRLVVNDNPEIGKKGSRSFIKGAILGKLRHLEASNIGAGPSTASLVASGARDLAVTWTYLDISNNDLSRNGVNEIFWAMRANRKIRILSLRNCGAGPRFGTPEDALLRHGISVVRFIKTNVILRELDLSFNALSSGAGIQILEALIDNFSIKKISLRGNLFDDEIAEALSAFFQENSIVEDFDIGENLLGYNSCFSIAEGLEWNRSIQTLLLDKNRLGSAGTATLDAFVHGLSMNCIVRTLNLDSNHFGRAWGLRFGEMIGRNASLLEFSLRDNHFDDESARSIISAYEHSDNLRELALSKDDVGDVLFEKLSTIYEKKRALSSHDDVMVDTTIQESPLKMLKQYEN